MAYADTMPLSLIPVWQCTLDDGTTFVDFAEPSQRADKKGWNTSKGVVKKQPEEKWLNYRFQLVDRDAVDASDVDAIRETEALFRKAQQTRHVVGAQNMDTHHRYNPYAVDERRRAAQRARGGSSSVHRR